MLAEKKFVVEIDEKCVDQKKHQMVTYIIGKAYNKKISQKKSCFSREVKKKFASYKNSSLPPRYQMVRSLLFSVDWITS